jgi:O-antigen ligase
MVSADNISKYWIGPALYGVVLFLPFSIAFSEIFILILLLGVLAHVAVCGAFAEFRSSLLYAVVAYILISLVSALLCEINPKSINEVGHLLLYIFLFAGIYMGRRAMFTRGHLYLFMAAVAFGAINGIVQYFNDYGILGRQAMHKPGIPPRIKGTFSNSLTYSGFYGMALFFLLPFLSVRTKRFRSALLLVLFLLIVALVLTHARGGLVAAVLTSTLFVLRQRKYVIHLISILVLIVVAALLFLPELVSLVSHVFKETVTMSTFSLRLTFVRAAVDFFLQNPILGIGPGAFTAAFELWKSSPDLAPAAHAHNQYLEVLSTTGILGFTAFIAILVIIFRRLLSSIARTGERLSDPVVVGAFYSLIFLCISSILECHFSDEEIFNLSNLVVGIGLGTAMRLAATHSFRHPSSQ